MNFWKRKLAAYLHDPPEKAYDYGNRHKQRAKVHADSFGVGELWEAMGGNPDWSAAAADRFVFPHGGKIGRSLGAEQKTVFVHPLSGRSDTGQPSLPADALRYPTQNDAEAWLSDIRPEWKSDDPQTLFLHAWRKWSDHAAQHSRGEGKGAELLPLLPADTRVPDGSIWHHCAVVSALEATRAGTGRGAQLRPAFFLFQIGPVQEFIAQARSTRDLWSGSYLLSWLTMHAIKAIADVCGPDAIIFPSLKGQPLYDFLETRLALKPDDADVLVPGIPNRFLAVVPAGFDAATVQKAFAGEWNRIAEECFVWLKGKGLPFDDHHECLWREQVEHHWHIAWQLWPWQSATESLEALKGLPLGADNPIHFAKLIAQSIPAAHRDDRCYRGGELDPGWPWSAHYQLLQHTLDARRALRDFRPFASNARRKPGHRDCLSGREEAVTQADIIENIKDDDLRHLFRHAEPLGAANLIKRVWHKAYLDRLNEVQGKDQLRPLRRARQSFDSVPSVAAGAFAHRLFKATHGDEDDGILRQRWLAFLRSASSVRDEFPDTIANFAGTDEERWLKQSDHSIFFPEIWHREHHRKKQAEKTQLYHSPEARERLADAEAALRALLSEAHAKPSSYYAVLALDGDQIGKWLSGEKSPSVGNVLSPKAVEYFRDTLQGEQTEEWLASPRPISPSWHLQFSEALANFGRYASRRIVEEVHHGQLIYSGGDDVLAMLPADEAIVCARDLRAAIQGRRADMSADCQPLFRDDAPEGFLWLKAPKKNQPTWPLLVPGPRITVSIGLAIGHVKEPLQDMIAEAQLAEKRAKAAPEKYVFDRSDSDPAKHGERWKRNEGWDRDALAITLFKRSGETIRWGSNFNSKTQSSEPSAAFPLLQYFQAHYRIPWENSNAEMPIASKFPYRIAELLGRYGANASTSDMLDIAKREVAFAISRQAITDKQAEERGSAFRRDDLQRLCQTYLDELAAFSWTRPGDKQVTTAPRPLSEFINLFLLEAFIRRQAD